MFTHICLGRLVVLFDISSFCFQEERRKVCMCPREGCAFSCRRALRLPPQVAYGAELST